MSWLSRLFKREDNSSAVAKTRLQMVLTHDRADVSPGLIELIKDDIIEVLADRLSIDREAVIVNLTQSASESRLVAEVPLQSNGRLR
ncbi:MAG: cell division topological specificity factor MinE [Anaerolineae bacterium]|nr:cell division topological specificity factor MinE [Anaerolineae bacterium]